MTKTSSNRLRRTARCNPSFLFFSAVLILLCSLVLTTRGAGRAGVRAPAAAGTFYPAEPSVLEGMVDQFLAEARADARFKTISGDIRAVLVPHAGYIFSGRTAAYAYAALEGKRYDTVVLLGSPHRVPVRGAAVYTGGGFRTPMGIVPVDEEAARDLIDPSSHVTGDELPHLEEHSLEVQLPFLKKVLGNFSIVPVLVMGDKSTLDSVSGSMAGRLTKASAQGKKLLILISTDLSHFPSREGACRCDGAIIDAFCTLDGDKLLKKNEEILKWRVPNLACAMCGIDAAYVGIRLARALGGPQAAVLDRSDSSDAGCEGITNERVVGYASVVILADAGSSAGSTKSAGIRAPAGTHESLMEEEQAFLLQTARCTLESYLRRGKVPAVEIPERYSEHLNDRRGVFVTLTKRGILRGCIGTYASDQPLYLAVQQMAISSGFHDPRFPPLAYRELREIRIEISVYLSDVREISSVDEFELGKDGIIIQIGSRSATFLPQVAVEQGWDRKTTLEQLCRKAGLEPSAWKERDARIFVYRTQVFHEKEKGPS